MRVRNKVEPLSEFTPPQPHMAYASPEDYEQMAAGMSDEEAIKKIGQRSSTSGKLVALLLVGGAVGLGFQYVQSSKRYETRMEGLEAAGQLEGDALLNALRTELESTEYNDVKVRVIRNLAHFKDKGAVPQFTTALDNAGIVRRAAALALAEIGSPAADSAKSALLKALPETDEKDRPQVVWALAVLKESSATDDILDQFTKGLLQGQPNFDPKVITEALGITKLSSPALTGHEDKSVRTLVAVALAEAASSEVVDPLVRMLQKPDEDSEVIRAAVAGLGRAGDPRAAGPLYKLMHDVPAMRQSVLDALGRSTAAPELGTLLAQAKEPLTRRDMVELVAKTHDPRSADPLAAMLGVQDEKTRIAAAKALADLGDKRALEPLLALAKSPDDRVGNDAVDALSVLGAPEAGKVLVKLASEFPHRKSTIMRALGASGTSSASAMLIKELKGDDIGAATKALGQLRDKRAYPILVSMLKRDPKIDFARPGVVTEMAYRNRLEAMTGLRYYQRPDPKTAAALSTIIEDEEDDPRLRLSAGATLGQIADAELFNMMLEKASSSELPEQARVAYAQGLWRRPNPALGGKLVSLLTTDSPGTLKIATALALGYAGDAATEDALIGLLDNEKARRYAAFALALGAGPKGAEKLLAFLPGDNDTEEVLRTAVGSNESDNFNLLTEPMFSSGQVYKRLGVADRLRKGTDKISYSYLWNHLTNRLSAGWGGPGGVTARFVRTEIFKGLSHSDENIRLLSASALASMNERGLLLAARDSGNREARQQLFAMDRPGGK